MQTAVSRSRGLASGIWSDVPARRSERPATLNESVCSAVDPHTTARRVVEQALSMIAGARCVAIELLVDGQLQSVYASGDAEWSGVWNAAPTGLAQAAITSGTTQRCDDTAADPRVDQAQCERLGIRSLLCVPLTTGERRPVGMLEVGAPLPHAFVDDDVRVLDQLAAFISSVILCATEMQVATTRLLAGIGGTAAAPPTVQFAANVISPRMASEHAKREEIMQIIDERAFDILLQPIVDLASWRPIGYEALARFRYPHGSPESVLADAHRVGLGIELDLALSTEALALRSRLPSDVYLAINVGPRLFADPRFSELLGDATGIVFEITEQHPISNHPGTATVIADLRARGNRLAIDDTGAGFASLSHLLHLRPDIVKLDRDLTIGIDRDPIRQALTTALVTFCDSTGASIVAEGIENAEQLEMVRSLGVGQGQGFHIGRPISPSGCFGDDPGDRVAQR